MEHQQLREDSGRQSEFSAVVAVSYSEFASKVHFRTVDTLIIYASKPYYLSNPAVLNCLYLITLFDTVKINSEDMKTRLEDLDQYQ